MSGYGDEQKENSDSKVAVSNIFIQAEISLKTMIESGIKFIFSKTKWNKSNSITGDSSGAQATGYSSGAQATGDRSIASTNGNYSSSEITNSEDIESKNAVAVAIGIQSKAKAAINNWIVLAEWDDYNTKIKWIKSAFVDDKKIKADTWYILKRGKFILAKKD